MPHTMPRADAMLSFTGVICTAFGPSAVLVFSVVGKHPELIILTVGAAFTWLCAISLAAVLNTMITTTGGHIWALLVFSVLLQEASRFTTYALYVRLLRGLVDIGLAPTPFANQPTGSRLVPAAIASGLGAGLMQTLVMYGDVLGGSLRPGTLYTPGCSGLSTFAVDALQSVAFQVLQVLLCIIGWCSAYPRRSVPLMIAIVMLRFLASATTLLNSSAYVAVDGCRVSLPCLFATVLMAGGLAVHVAAKNICIPSKVDSDGGR